MGVLGCCLINDESTKTRIFYYSMYLFFLICFNAQINMFISQLFIDTVLIYTLMSIII